MLKEGEKMSDILKQLYYGNISPWEKPFNRDSEYGKVIKTVSATEEKLVALLNETEKELFQQFSNAHGDLSRIAIADSFVDGFCLGMRIGIEVMEKQH